MIKKLSRQREENSQLINQNHKLMTELENLSYDLHQAKNKVICVYCSHPASCHSNYQQIWHVFRVINGPSDLNTSTRLSTRTTFEINVVCVVLITACHTDLVSWVSLSAGKQREGARVLGMSLI